MHQRTASPSPSRPWRCLHSHNVVFLFGTVSIDRWNIDASCSMTLTLTSLVLPKKRLLAFDPTQFAFGVDKVRIIKDTWGCIFHELWDLVLEVLHVGDLV